MKKKRVYTESRTARIATGVVLAELLTGVERERRMSSQDVHVQFGIVDGRLVATVSGVGVSRKTIAVYRIRLEAV